MNIESNRIEYKRELTDDFEKEVVAFLNYKEGGCIYIGIDDYGNAVGVADADRDMLKIKDRLRTNILPSCLGLFDVCLETTEGKHIVKIIVASGSEKPYYLRKPGMTGKGCFMRIGTAAEPMLVQMIESLFSKRTRNTIRRIKSPRQDLKFEQLKIYYEGAGMQLNEQFAKTLELFTDEKEYNYVAYLLADENIVSIKLAKYSGTDRYDLVENKEYGNCSLIKATKQILDRLEVENSTFTKITSKERLERRMWNPIALREAVINALVHNDYSSEVFPKFEIFDDRIEITSYGTLPVEISKGEFFGGASVPRNKEIMRIFRDLELVEYLGSGLPRILKAYGKRSFKFSENFMRVVFPIEKQVDTITVDDENVSDNKADTLGDNYPTITDTTTDTTTVTITVKKVILAMSEDMLRQEIQDKIGLANKVNFLQMYLNPALNQGLIERTIPDKPNSRSQKYRLTSLGLEVKNKLLKTQQS